MCKPIYDNLGGKFCVSQSRLSKLCGNKCKLMHLELNILNELQINKKEMFLSENETVGQ